MTVAQIKESDKFLCGIELEHISAYLIYLGGQKCQYYVFHNGEILFEGNDYKPSPLHNQDDLESVIDLLGFICCKPGDTDPEYFAKYTKKQLDWANSFECEQLQGYISDFENKAEPEYMTNAQIMFTSSFVNAERLFI